MLLRCDIEEFFESITKNRLKGIFIQLGMSDDAAETLAAFVTIRERLALGLNASPMLANLVCLPLDKEISELARTLNCVYTRYADDIAVSGDQVPDAEQLASIVEDNGFRLSEGKTRVTKRGQAHFVTGLSISDPYHPHVPKQYKRRLRQELFYCEKFGVLEHLRRIGEVSYQRGVNRIDGTVRYVCSIESAIAPLIREKWRNVLIAAGARVSYAPLHNTASIESTFVLDEAEFWQNGKRYLALACVTTDQIDHLRSATSALLRKHLVNPFSTGRKKKLEKKGLHFSDAPEDLRSRYVDFLPFLPFRAYIAFGSLPADADYEALYSTLLGRLLPNRLIAHDRDILALVFEENPRVPRRALDRLVRRTYRNLEENNDRRPLKRPKVIVSTKRDEPAFSVPDALLGIFCRYFTSNDAGDMYRPRFESLRHKFRHIANIDTGEKFSRRHPLEIQ